MTMLPLPFFIVFIYFYLQTLTTELHYYYIVELSFYWSLMFSQFTDIKRKDFLIMFLHHLATISLITFSYVNNMVRVGTLVMCLHDASDVLLEVSNDDRSDIESSSDEEDAPSPTKKTHNTATNGTNGANGTNGYLTGTTCPDEH
ncbi:Ceramide synthase 6 [Acipenser ruthenus]|uniref:Ceramide synthase 6 n=1 Tax=Acipenser ruthenus TaxID=7906 RepID=A0A444TYV6_ACIRT|nr:Ceramide synthase 6 [Acipenser ruthenus]